VSVGGPINDLILQAFAGLKTATAAEVRPGGMRPNEARLLQNIETAEDDLKVIKGQKRVRAAKVDGARPILGLWRTYKGSTGARKTLVHTRNKIWTLSGSATADISGATLTLTSGYPHTTVSYQDVVYGGNGVNSFWSWAFTGDIAGAVGPSEKYAFVFAFEEKLVHARGATNKDKVTWSDEGLPTTYDAVNFFFYPPDRSDELTMCYPLNGEVICATPLRIGKTVGGLPPRAVIDLDAGRGCVSHYSAAYLAGWLYFVGAGGMVLRTDGSTVQEVSAALDTSDIDCSNAKMLRGAARDGRYYVLQYRSKATGSGFPNRMLVYDEMKDRWYGPHTIMRSSTMVEWRAPGDDGRLLGGSPSGYAAVMWSGSSNAGTKITGVYEGPVFTGADPLYRIGFDEFGIEAAKMTSGTATLGMYVDRAAAVSTIASVNLRASGAIEGDRDATTVTRTQIIAPKKVKFNQSCFRYQPRISIAQKSGSQGRVMMFWIKSRQLKGI